MDVHQWVGLRFSEKRIDPYGDDPYSFLHRSEGFVTLANDQREIDIGTFSAVFVDVDGAAAEGTPLFDVFDCDSAMVDYYELYDRDETFKSNVLRAAREFDLAWWTNLLVLERLIIQPQYRGNARGLIALRGLMDHLRPGAGLIAMKPFPLQHESQFLASERAPERTALMLDRFEPDRRKATARLRRYYARLGFKKVPGSELMVCSAVGRLPAVESLMRPRRHRQSPTRCEDANCLSLGG